MATLRIDSASLEWGPGSPYYGPNSIYQGQEVVRPKVLSDRRAEGGGIVFLARFLPPPGKVIKIIAVARSDEHSFTLSGGRGTKSGKQRAHPGGYALNTDGQPHSAFIGTETESLIVYTGEPDEIQAFEVVDRADAS